MGMTLQQHLPKILLVDDQALNVQLLYQAIGEFGEIYFAENAGEALAIFQRELPELVLLDIEMPGVSGFELFRQLKDSAATAHDFSAIFISAHEAELYELPALLLGAVDFLPKPFNLLVAKARIQFHLNLRQRIRQLKQAEMCFLEMIHGLPGLLTLWDTTLRNRFSTSLSSAWFRGLTASHTGQALGDFLGDALFARVHDSLASVMQGQDLTMLVQFPDETGQTRQGKLRMLALRDEASNTPALNQLLLSIDLLPDKLPH